MKINLSRWFYFYPIFFGLAYSQEALFFSNQNTKFISGLALGSYGDIDSDWMATITDSFPVFSKILQWQFELLGSNLGIHFIFLLIVAAYGYSGIWLAKNIIEHKKNSQITLFVFSLIWLLVNMVLFRNFLLSFFPDGLAGQYMIGSYYQPCVYGFLLLMGTASYISGNTILAAFFFVLTPIFHPIYSISSILIATSITILPANRSLNITWKTRFIFLSIVVLPIAIYAVWIAQLLISGDPLIQKSAHRLLSETVIPFHTIPSEWPLRRSAIFFITGLSAVWFSRKWLVGQLLLVLLIMVVISVLWAVIISNSTIAVIAPWRVSVFIAPLSWIILITTFSKWITQKVGIKFYKTLILKRVSIIVLSLASLIGIANLIFNYQLKKEQKYYHISRFLEAYHVHGNHYLVPIDEMHIRLEAGVPVYVTWKSHPNKDSEFLEWYIRIELAREIYDKPFDQEELSEMLESHSITHIVWPVSKKKFPFMGIGKQIYNDVYYSVWDMR